MSISLTDCRNIPQITASPYYGSYIWAGVQYWWLFSFDTGYYGNVWLSVHNGYTYYNMIHSGELNSHWRAFYIPNPSWTVLFVWQPYSFWKKTVPNIIYSYARFRGGLDAAEIDLPSFTATDAFCIGNNFYFSPVFIGDNSLKIIQELCEQSAMVFIYRNGDGKLACGYFVNTPVSPEWVLEESDFVVKSYAEMVMRKTPKTVKAGWNSHNMTPQFPVFGATQTTIENIDGELMNEEYEARWVENSTWTAYDFYGSYIDFGDYMKLEIELGLKAFKMDLNEVVQIKHSPFGLSIDDDFPDYFRIHKIVYHLSSMTATVTLVKSKIWNSTAE